MFDTLVGFFDVGITLVFSPVLRHHYNRWGVKPEEMDRPMPGDDFVPISKIGYTRSILIEATPDKVWPWVAQLGQGRGGMYSYDGLENLVGCDIHSVDAVLPEFQNPKVGEVIRMGPKGYPCFRVALVEPGRAMVLVTADNKTEAQVDYLSNPPKGYSMGTWQFLVEPVGEAQTRLFVRQKLTYTDDMRIIWRITEPIGFVMERKMLKGVKARAERLAKA